MKRIIAALLAPMLLCGSFALASAPRTELDKNNMLKCFGTLLKNSRGETVLLRGTNLGGWLLQESWMGALTGVDAQWDIVTTLENRFGTEKARELIDSFEDNFITVNDLDRIASLGFNCVRVPFWYRNLQTDDNGTWRRKADGSIDFSRLDWIVEECGKRGIYVILDMHGLPGFQSVAHHCGKLNSCKLYENSEQGEYYRRLSVELWREIAAHFNGNPTVAAYDLMNEPMCDFTDEEKDDALLWQTYDMLYDAVRSVDGEHIITIEAIWRFDNLPNPQRFGWKNVMYQLHLYDDSNADFANAVSSSLSKHFFVPVYVGEFKPGESSDWSSVLSAFNEHNCSWTTWTYKGHCSWGEGSDWFIVGSSGDGLNVDVHLDSFEEIAQKWSEELKTENRCKIMGDVDTLSAFAGAPVKNNFFDDLGAAFSEMLKPIIRFYYKIAALFNGN